MNRPSRGRHRNRPRTVSARRRRRPTDPPPTRRRFRRRFLVPPRLAAAAAPLLLLFFVGRRLVASSPSLLAKPTESSSPPSASPRFGSRGESRAVVASAAAAPAPAPNARGRKRTERRARGGRSGTAGRGRSTEERLPPTTTMATTAVGRGGGGGGGGASSARARVGGPPPPPSADDDDVANDGGGDDATTGAPPPPESRGGRGRPTTELRRRSRCDDSDESSRPRAPSAFSASSKLDPRGGGGGAGGGVATSKAAASKAGKSEDGGGATRSSKEASSSSASTTTRTTKKSALSNLRSVVFPIYGKDESIKFFLVASIKFYVILALTLTRDAKDVLVVNDMGAEAIAFLKIYGVLPAATLFIALYSKMASILDKQTLFYATCVPFFLFFALFDAIVYPNASSLQPSLESVQTFLGGGGRTTATTTTSSGGLLIPCKIVAHWTSALFYVVAEIYASVSVGLLFWQYANDVVSVEQAKRFYPLFSQMSGLAPIVAGQYVVRYASRASTFRESLRRLTAAVSFAGVMICAFYRGSVLYLDRSRSASADADAASSDEKDGGDVAGEAKEPKKPRMSVTESAKFLASSEYLRLLATLVVGYGLSINLTEITWKSLVKRQYPDKLEYQRYMGNFSSAVGLSTFVVIFFGVHVIRVLGWRVGAVATPTVMAALAVPFFGCILSGLDSEEDAAAAGAADGSGGGGGNKLSIAVALGTVQSLCSKVGKYALFDPTTQMAYIPLDDESKTKGKAAIDVLGSRIGKSGGSLIQQGLVLIFGDILRAAPAVAALFYGVLFAWIRAANGLGKLFAAKTKEMETTNGKRKRGGGEAAAKSK